jgi:protocatechuate 3,4-dioxygenase beta subunit
MRHQGAITGRVLDENGVGKAGVSVVAYRSRLPLRPAGRALSDDRGIYRVHGLEPGKYWVRSASHILEDGSGWLPTFGPRAREVRDAQRLTTMVDTDTPDADISPEPGMLFHLSGLIGCDPLSPVNVTLSSETGRRSQQSGCGKVYRFDGLSPGVYEVFATTPDGMLAAYLEISLERDHDAASLQLMQVPRVSFDVRRAGANARLDAPVSIEGRRQDLSDAASPEELKSGFLAPGHWEVRARVPAGQYVESITSTGGPPSRLWQPFRAADWFEVFIPAGRSSIIRIMASDQAGQIQGRVMREGKSVPTAPVFLWPVGEATRRSLGGDREMRADTEGNFRFESLPPGDYRLLASFDVNEMDEDLILISGGPTVVVEKLVTARIDLPLWSAP